MGFLGQMREYIVLRKTLQYGVIRTKIFSVLLHKMEAILYPYKVAEICHLLAYVLTILTSIPIIPNVRIMGTQKETFISLNLFITHTSDLQPYKKNPFKYFY